jgi:hypothetical protein
VAGVRALLWILAGVVLLDVALVVVVAICAAVVRRRGPRAVRDPVTWWPMETEREAGGHGRDVVVPIRTGETAPAASEQRRPRHRTLAVALVAATVFAGTAFASPQIRRFVATAIGTVTGTSQTEAGGQDPEGQPAPGGPSDRPGVAGPKGSSPSPDRTAEPSPGPVVEPRPPGVPHGGVLAPAAPSSLTASARSSSQVDLVWADVDGEIGFRVERSSDGAGGWNAVGDTEAGGTAWSDGGLSQGTTYYYRVVATNLGGDSPPSNVASATTSIDPASPTTVTAVAGSATQIDLAWTDVANETGYRLERSDGSGGWTTVATTGQDVTASSDTGLTPGTTYSYRVFATNAAGDSPASDVVSATTPPDPGPEGQGATSPPSPPGTESGDPDPLAEMASLRIRVE